MGKALRPTRFDTLPNTPSSTKEFKHWFRTFEYYLEVLPNEGLDKLKVLINFISPEILEYISDCTSYDSAIETIKSVYIKPPNTIFARHLLATRRQQYGETFDEYIQALKILAKDCKFQAVSAVQYQDEAIRDAFINGISSNDIRQRLIENSDMTLDSMFCKARAYESAQKHSENYLSSQYQGHHSASALPSNDNKEPLRHLSAAQKSTNELCYFCGNNRHPRSKCPARKVDCNKCGKKGHFAKVCKSSKPVNNSNNGTIASTIFQPTLASIISGNTGNGLSKSICTILIKNNK